MTGTVYGVLLNDRATVERMRPQFDGPPYKAPPVAPILYIKPRNTFARDGAVVSIPADPGRVRIDATIGAVIARAASRVDASDALSFVKGFVIVSDVTLPHDSVYRPAITQRCRDGFCPIGVMRAASAFDVGRATIVVTVDGVEVQRRMLTNLVRPLPRLIADVTAFMTLDEDDVLLLGAPDDGPLCGPGDRVTISVDGLDALTHAIVLEQAA